VTNNRLVLIDGHAILHRAYHAYPPTLRTRNGRLTNAVYGFTRILLSTLEKISPKYVVVAFDLPKPTFRHKRFKDYKAHRPEVDEELKEQIPTAHEVVKTLNIPIFEVEGFEADDIIGTLAMQAGADKRRSKTPINADINVIIVTGDKDALQLLNGHVQVFMPGRGRKPDRIYDHKRFKKEYGFEPEMLVDYKALVGDPSDAIPGVKGIGPVTAKRLIGKFGTVEKIYKNLDNIKGSVSDKLKADKKQARLSKELAKIVTDVPIKFNLKQAELLDYDKQKIVSLFEKLEFKSLIRKLPGEHQNKKPANTEQSDARKNKQMGLF